MVLRRCAKAASMTCAHQAICPAVSGSPVAGSAMEARSRRITAESTCGGGMKLPGPTSKRPVGRAYSASLAV